MTNARLLRGTELRYVLTINLALNGRATIFDQIEMLEDQGFAVPGHASKVVSDALAHADEAFWDALFGKREAS